MPHPLPIAAVEDKETDRCALTDALQRYFREQAPEFLPRLSLFPSRQAFRKGYAPSRFRLLFLDIYLGDGNGMDIARAVREQEDSVPIIFLTTTPDFAVESYEVFASGYLLKPIRPGDHPHFQQLMGRVLAEVRRPAELHAESMYRPVCIPFDEILYIDTSSSHRFGRNRNTMVYLANGKSCSIDTSFAVIREDIGWDERFFECNHCLMVNFQHVKKLSPENMFLLKDGTAIPVSRRRLKECEAAYFSYLLKK